jgi:spore germination protein KB
MFLLGIPLVNGTVVLFVPSLMATVGGRDGWMAPLLAPLSIVMLVALLGPLIRRWPDQSFIQVAQSTLGRWVGGLLGAVFSVWAFHTNAIILRQFGDFIKGTVLIRTPILIVQLLILLAVIWVARAGLEVLARCAAVLVPIDALFLMTIVVLGIRESRFQNLLPVLEHGITPVLRAALIPSAWVSELVCLAFLWPRLNQPRQGPAVLVSASIWTSLNLAVGSLIGIATFGPTVAKVTFSLFAVARVVSIAEFLERIEPLLMIVWVSDNFIKISVFHYVATESLRQSLGLRERKPLVIPGAALMLVLAAASLDSTVEMADWLMHVWPLYSPLVTFGIPIIALCAGLWRMASRGSRA